MGETGIMLKNMNSQNPTSKARIAVLYSHSLFAAGIEARLRDVNQFEITRVDASDIEAIEHLNETRLDVIIVDINDSGVMFNVIIQFLRGNNISKIIGLDMNSNEINLCHKEKHLALSGVDLISVIEKDLVM